MLSRVNRSPFDHSTGSWLRMNGLRPPIVVSLSNHGLTMTGYPSYTVRPEALEGTNGAQDRPEFDEGLL